MSRRRGAPAVVWTDVEESIGDVEEGREGAASCVVAGVGPRATSSLRGGNVPPVLPCDVGRGCSRLPR